MNPDVHYACDGGWWDTYWEDYKKAAYSGPSWTQDVAAAPKYGLHYIESRAGTGLDEKVIIQGSNSTYQAINLLWIWGARIILTLGLDMQNTGGKTHWHGNHKGSLANCPGFQGLINQFEKMQPEKYGLRVINCSRATALKCFERMALEEALELFGIKNAA